MRARFPIMAVALAAMIVLTTSPLVAQDAQSRLWDAAIAGDTLVIREALSDGAKIDSLDTRRNPNGRRALNWAAWHDRVPAIRMLIAMGAPIEAENITGFSALHHAAEAGSMDAARALLAAGANPAHANKAGRLPAETARAQGHDDIAALLDDAVEGGKQPAEP